MNKGVMHIYLVTVSNSDENIETLPKMTIVDNGKTKYISTGYFEIEEAIIEVVKEHLGENYAELIAVAVESITPTDPPRQRRKRQEREGDYS